MCSQKYAMVKVARAVVEGMENRRLLAAVISTLANFDSAIGSGPGGNLVFDSGGNLFGVTYGGGASNDGTIFKVTTGNNVPSMVAQFNGTNGSSPLSDLVRDSAGNLYGTTFVGGAAGLGTIFKVAVGSSTITTLASFNNTNGANPRGRLVLDSAGNLFGATQAGGSDDCGVVFKLPANSSTITALASLTGDNNGGFTPWSGVVADSAGNLYGTTLMDTGVYGYGTVFKLAAGANTVTTIGVFDGTNGNDPISCLNIDSAGNLYGATLLGGAYGCGTVFKIAAGTTKIITLASFTAAIGYEMHGSMIVDASGNLYGTVVKGGANNCGSIFKVAAGTNALTTLVSFNSTNGDYPVCSLIADSSGNLYGSTAKGGANNLGTVFKLTGSGFVVSSTTAPEVGLLGNSASIVDGDTTPSTLDSTDFGSTPVGTIVSKTYTVKNTGTAALTTSGLTVPTGYTVTEGLSASIAAGGSDTFTVKLNATAAGTYAGQISFANNVVAKNPYNFSITGTVTAVATAPEVDVVGNAVSIVDGDSTPSTADATNFGSTPIGTIVSKTFTVKNTGTAALTTSGLTVPTGYTVTEGLSASIAAGGSDTFTVKLNATAAGTYAGQISFANNDATENPYNFSITGIVTAPEVDVLGNTISIVDGDSTPSTTDATDFGTTTTGTIISKTFTVKNTGTAALTTSGLTVPTGFTVTEGLSASIAAGGSDTFTVKLNAAAAGTFSGSISFANNDASENPYNFSIKGIVNTPVPEAAVFGNSVEIVDGDTTPATTDYTDFGTGAVGTAITKTFTVKNLGTAALTTSGLTVPSGFAIDSTDTLLASIPAGGSDTFKVKLSATAAGIFTGSISFANNDANENPYNFAVKGVVNSSIFAFSASTITVTGTAGNDLVRGSIANGVLTLKVNALVATYPSSYVTKIVVNALGGNDSILMSQSETIATSLNGGDGDDVIYGGAGVDVINGGNGTDIAFKGSTDTVTLVEEILA